MYCLQIIGGVIGLCIGAELIVRGSINLSYIYKWSTYLIGFTIVALGTSLPEFASSIQAIKLDSVSVAIGNVIGSNVANILLVIGAVGLVSPIIFPESNQPLAMFIATLIILVIFYLSIERNFDSVSMGVVFICLSVAYLFWQYKFSDKVKEEDLKPFSKTKSYIYLFFGFILLYYGSLFFIKGAIILADTVGVSETIIGLTVVALGTSLPELVTGIAAARKQQFGLAVGTILGSNIYNIAVILGVILFTYKGELNNLITDNSEKMELSINAIIMAIVTLLFVSKLRWGLLIGPSNRIGRRTGTIFIGFYLLYILYNFL